MTIDQFWRALETKTPSDENPATAYQLEQCAEPRNTEVPEEQESETPHASTLGRRARPTG
jgi:hypothetical protein